MKIHTICIFTILLLVACEPEMSEPSSVKHDEVKVVAADTTVIDAVHTAVPVSNEKDSIGQLEQRLIDAGLVDVQSMDSTIFVDLKYSTEDNFMKQDVYGILERAYLQPDVAEKLVRSQSALKQIDSSLSLLVYDAVRPRSVQQLMWNLVDMPMEKKVKFISNPRNGSIHNYGAAVDLTIADSNGKPLDMGADFDDPSILAWPIKEAELLKDGKLNSVHVENRKLLRKVMAAGGFFNIQSEWWHFNSCYRVRAQELYEIVE